MRSSLLLLVCMFIFLLILASCGTGYKYKKPESIKSKMARYETKGDHHGDARHADLRGDVDGQDDRHGLSGPDRAFRSRCDTRFETRVSVRCVLNFNRNRFVD